MIDLRSDTVTRPTAAMREAMAWAEVGDDVYGEDPTVNRLEMTAAETIGKEAAMFVPSGTMGNQISILAHTRRGDEIIVEADAHIFTYEVGGPAVLSGVQTRPVKGERGFILPETIQSAIRAENIHAPRTGLLCLENTHNRAGGAVVSLESMKAMVDVAHSNHIPVHLDGARIFNAATALGCEAKAIAQYVDSVMFCLSKGLSAPVGSILAGPLEFIQLARKYRKMLGGGMRQAGILAAAGLIALETMAGRLAEDHEHAKQLAEGLSDIPGIDINPSEVQTNILLFSIAKLGVTADDFLERLAADGLLGGSFGPYIIRFVTHKDISAEQVGEAIALVAKHALAIH